MSDPLDLDIYCIYKLRIKTKLEIGNNIWVLYLPLFKFSITGIKSLSKALKIGAITVMYDSNLHLMNEKTKQSTRILKNVSILTHYYHY